MTGTVFDIKHFAVHDGDGIRTTVFIKGCPLKCRWCHNPEGISFKPQMQYVENKCINCGECVKICKNGAHRLIDGKHKYDRSKCTACGACQEVCIGAAMILCGREMTAEQVLSDVIKDKAFYDASGGGVTLSGGECLCSPDFCAEILRLCKENGINTAVDTSGYVDRSAIDKVVPYTDVFLYDIKHIDGDEHKRFTSRSNEKILDNLFYLDSIGKHTEIRIPLIKGVNDGVIKQIGDLIAGLKHLEKVRVLPYNNLIHSKYAAVGMLWHRRGLEVPDEECTERAEKILKGLGLNVVSRNNTAQKNILDANIGSSNDGVVN